MNKLLCPCMSEKQFSVCCEPYLLFTGQAETPEALMRSRYTAYTLENWDYIEATMKGPAKSHFSRPEAELFAQTTTWMGLRVIKVPPPKENSGTVEYIAFYKQDNMPQTLHEISQFRKENGAWFYITGDILSDS
jgi:SEC-C motif domain protein